jgi:acyl-coenzyme A synthetase/AMP-(fatty) acid ligase
MRRDLPSVAERTLVGAYERVLARTPDAEAQADETGSVTFAGSFERSLRLAAGFAAHGVGPGQLTALRTVVVRGAVEQAAALRGRFRVVPLGELEEYGRATPAPGDAGQLMAYMYTSGTTGASKGVLISHAHAYTYASREHQERPRDGDRILVTLPVFHLAGQWYGVYQALIHGLPSFVAPGFSVSRYWDTVRTQGSTVTVMLGAMAELLQQQPPRPDDADNPLDLAVMAPLASDVTGFCRRFGLRAAAVYGMSERRRPRRAARYGRGRRGWLPARGVRAAGRRFRRPRRGGGRDR